MTMYIREDCGAYRVASAQEILYEGRLAIDKIYDARKQTCFTQPCDVKNYFAAKLSGMPNEVFAVMYLDTKHQLIKYEEPFSGTIDSCPVPPREIARRALELNAKATILAHNHPSGCAQPSQADKIATSNIQRSLSLFDITVLDHIIIAGNEAASMSELGMM
jgi:DNA repair protein RadC